MTRTRKKVLDGTTKSLLADLELLVTTKSQFRLQPSKCAFCGKIFQRLSEFTKFDTSDFAQLLQHLSIPVLADIDQLASDHFDLWKCNRKLMNPCNQNRFKYPELKSIMQKHNINDNIRDVTRYREGSSSSFDGIEPQPVAQPVLTPQYDIQQEHSPQQATRQVHQPQEALPLRAEEQNLEKGVCFLDSSFFHKFKCCQCQGWLEMKNVVSLIINKLWGKVTVFCKFCKIHTSVSTVDKPEETITRYAAAIDVTGMMVKKAEAFMLCNNIYPPTYHKISENVQNSVDKSIEEAATLSVERALIQERALTSSEENGISVRADFGWQTRSRNNAQSGHMMFVGEKTNKIVAFNCYDRSCSLCDKHGLRNHQGPCNSTFEGTAKSMEPVGMTDCIRDVTITRGHNISEIIVDNDGNTTDAIQAAGFSGIKITRDRNHTIKNITAKVMAIFPSPKSMARKYYLKRVKDPLTYGRSAGWLSRYYNAVVDHSAGDHSNCTGGCPLTEPAHSFFKHMSKDQESKIRELFTNLSVMSESLSKMKSTSQVESVHRSIISHTGYKVCLYTKNFRKRTRVAVCIRNNGIEETMKVLMDKLKISRLSIRVMKRLGKQKKKKPLDRKGMNQRKKKRKNEAELFTDLHKMKEYDRAIDLTPKNQIQLDKSKLGGQVILYDLETSGFRRDQDILQLAAICVKLESGDIVDTYNAFIQPTEDVPVSASEVNNLYSQNNQLCRKRPDGSMEPLPTQPSRLVLNSFIEWALFSRGKRNANNTQVLLLGYNNHAFDDYFLLHHGKRKLENDNMVKLRSKLFSCDLKTVTNCKGKLVDLLRKSNGSQELIDMLHDGLQDCKAMLEVIKHKQIKLDSFCAAARSFETIHHHSTDPLLRAGLVTKVLAEKMAQQLSCEYYLSMSDEDVVAYFTNLGASKISIATCLKKRKDYVDLLKRTNYQLQ